MYSPDKAPIDKKIGMAPTRTAVRKHNHGTGPKPPWNHHRPTFKHKHSSAHLAAPNHWFLIEMPLSDMRP